MTRIQWLETLNKNENVTFIIMKAVKDDYSPMYHAEYRTTPIRGVYEWLQSEDGYIVINRDHPPIDVTGNWEKWYRGGRLKCAIITTEDDLYKMYGDKQGEEMIEYYNTIFR